MFSFSRSSSSSGESALWENHEIKFNNPQSVIAPRRGEIVFDSLNSVEDSTGGKGERGRLSVTNLRFIWQSHSNARKNMSIGYSTVSSTSIKTLPSKLKGNVQGLSISASQGSSRFEFIFLSLVKASPRLFTTAQAVCRAFETSTLYRECKLRGSLFRDRALILLPNEKIFSRLEGVWNVSNDTGNLGIFYITTFRIVWHALIADNFSISVPYIQMKNVEEQLSKFGPTFTIETHGVYSPTYFLGFRVEPKSAMDTCLKEISSLRATNAASPVYGIEYEVEAAASASPAASNSSASAPAGELASAVRVSDDVEIIESFEDSDASAYTAYLASAGASVSGSEELVSRPLMFSADLGIAIETPPAGLTVAKLWSVM